MDVKSMLLDLHTSWCVSAQRAASASLSAPCREAGAYLSCVQDIESILDKHFPGWSCEVCGKILSDSEEEVCAKCKMEYDL